MKKLLNTAMLFTAITLIPVSAYAGQAATTYTKVSDVIAGGGGSSSSGSYTMTGTIGQPIAVGPVTGGSYTNQSGFWNIRTGDTIAPTMPVFALLSPSSSYSVPITNLSSSDVGSGVTGYYFSADPPAPPTDAWTGVWVAPTPVSLISATKGRNQTFHVWARDEAGNISLPATASTDILLKWLLSVSFGGSGGSTITSSPTGIACSALTAPNNCSASFDELSVVALSGAPDIRSEVSGWNGADNVSGNPVNVTMSGDKSVIGTFSLSGGPARIVYDKSYPSLFATIQALTPNKTIQSFSGITFTENLLFNQGYTTTLQGGMNSTWDTQTGFSTIKGTMKVNSGRLTASGIKIKP
jgi:hypothetical protein